MATVYCITLSLYFFAINLVYGLIKKIASISLLVTDIKTSLDAWKLGLVDASKLMYSEAFGRYDPKLFRRIFLTLLEQLDFLEIAAIESLSRFILVDDSIFPALRTMV